MPDMSVCFTPFITSGREVGWAWTLNIEAPTPQNGKTYSICQQQPTNCLSVFDNFVGYVLKGLNSTCKTDQADFTEYMSFLPSNLVEEISPDQEALSANT